jgi:heptosyltransferase-2
MPNWVGDLVMATPVLTDLRNAFPKSSITAMCRYPLSELLKEDEAIDELFFFHAPSSSFSRRDTHRSIIHKIQAGKYDLGILLTNSFSSAWWFWQGNVKRRLGYAVHFRRYLLTDPVSFEKTKEHQIDKYKKLLEPLGIAHSKTKPRLFLKEEEIKESKKLLYQRGYKEGSPLIGINPGAAYGSAKCWLPERFRLLAERLVKEGFFVVFFGDASSQELIHGICQGLSPKVMNLSALTSLRELACLIRDVDLLITNDSGPMHIASSLDTPLIALFGSTDHQLTGPYGKDSQVIRKEVACSPCFKRVCPIDFPCMKGISVDVVFASVMKQLSFKKGNHV